MCPPDPLWLRHYDGIVIALAPNMVSLSNFFLVIMDTQLVAVTIMLVNNCHMTKKQSISEALYLLFQILRLLLYKNIWLSSL